MKKEDIALSNDYGWIVHSHDLSEAEQARKMVAHGLLHNNQAIFQVYLGTYLGEALDNRAEPRDNASVIAGGGWVHGRQAARIR